VIVVDASALLEVLLQTPDAAAVKARLSAAGELCAPHLIDLEVAQVLRRYAAGNRIEAARCRDALTDLLAFPMERYPHQVFLPRVWELRHNLTAYDAIYIALAEAFEMTLLTRDRRLAAASGHRARVDLV